MPTTFTFTPPTQSYSNTPIVIADGNGANSMVFSGIYEPAKLPEFTNAHRSVKVTRTRPGIGHPPYRIFSSFGANANSKDLALTLPFVTPNALAQLQGYYDASPGVFCVSIGGGGSEGTYVPDNMGGLPADYTPVTYLAMFKENGLTPKNYDFNQRCFTSVQLEMYILNSITVTFS